MSNLYEILEVSEKASKEVIEKAYRVLAKKYHPDLQDEAQKQEAERKMKQINEAYDILSNEEKRKQYDMELEEKRKQYDAELEQKRMAKQEKENTNVQEYDNAVYEQSQREYQQKRQEIQNEINKAYNDAYYNYLRRLRI